MGYDCHDFCNGQILSAEALNEMERGILNSIRNTKQDLTPEQQAQARANIDACSMREVTDKLCPSFTESGTIVTCEPVEGYPLEVVGSVNPNLIPVDLTDVNNWEYNEAVKIYEYHMDNLPSGTYTFCVEGGFIQVGNYGIADSILTFTHTGGSIVFSDTNSFAADGGLVTVKLEVGTEYTGTNYATTITRCGKNIFGGDALVDALESKDNGKGVTKNEANKTVTFDPGLMTRTGHLFNKFKENTQYTIILYGYQTTAGGATNIRVQYTDETAESLYFGTAGNPNPANEPGYAIHKTNPNKTVWRITPQWVASATVLYYDQCGVFEGNISTEEFEAYRAGTFPVGESVPALPGVNTLWSSSGDITVTGKADPNSVIQDLTAKVNELSATVNALIYGEV